MKSWPNSASQRQEHLQFNTSWVDLTRMPAVTKALLALDISGADLVIARGGWVSGFRFTPCNNGLRGRLLSAATSHHMYCMGNPWLSCEIRR